MALSACGGADSSSTKGASDGDSSGPSREFHGAGASSQQHAVDTWSADYRRKNGSTPISYNSTGSGAGLDTFMTGAIDWAGTDAPLSDEQIERSRSICASGSAFEIPDYVSSLDVVFNIQGAFNGDISPENKHLNLDPATLAAIFDGRITQWDDSAIKAQNPLTDLPSTHIIVVHRSDRSGSTRTLAAYLKATAPDAWNHDVQETWPNDVGKSVKGTSGMVAALSQLDGGIGYVDASAAGSFGTVSLKVGQSHVPPSPDGVAKTLGSSPVRKVSRSSSRVVVDVNYKTEAKDAYPLASVSYAVACPAYAGARSGTFVKSWLGYVVGKDAQQAVQEAVGAVPLNSSLAGKAARSVAKIKVR